MVDGRAAVHAAGQRSYGVVTFSMPQQALIQQLIEQGRARYPEIEPHFAEDYPEQQMKLRTVVVGSPASTTIVHGLLRSTGPPAPRGGGEDQEVHASA